MTTNPLALLLQEQATTVAEWLPSTANVTVVAGMCVWLVTVGLPRMQQGYSDQLDAERSAQAKERELDRAEVRELVDRFTASLKSQEEAHTQSERKQHEFLERVIGILQDKRPPQAGPG